MFAKSKTSSVSNSNAVFDYLKGLIISILTSLALVIFLALILNWFDIPETVIIPVTFVIKYLSVIIGAIVAVKGSSRGLIKGALFGLVYIIISFLVFSILSKSFSIDMTTLLDVVSSVLIGAIVGIIKVNKN